MLPDWSLKSICEMEIFFKKLTSRYIPVKLFEAVLPVQYVPIQWTKLIECYLSTLVSVKHALHNRNLSKCQNLSVTRSPIIMLIVVMLNSVPFPFTRAACNSWGVIVPDLFASTLIMTIIWLFGLPNIKTDSCIRPYFWYFLSIHILNT